MIPISVTQIEEGSFEAKKGELKKILREVHADIGEHWHQKYLPWHFEPFAKQKYKHRKRSFKYSKRKRKLAAKGVVKKGGTVDNVFSGQTERNLENLAVIRPTARRVTVVMTGPRYITSRMEDEVTAVTPAESRAIANRMVEMMAEKLEEVKTRKVTKAG